MNTEDIRSVVAETQTYYDGPADEIYRRIWGDDVHLGLFEEGITDLPAAAARTNEVMAQAIRLDADDRVLDAGCGYGSAARHLAKRYGCRVVGTNISRKELERARERARGDGLEERVSFEYGDFHDMKFEDASFDVVWSQEAFLHGVDKTKILSECKRVLRPGGTLAFTDILVRRDTPQEDRARIHERVKSPDMWDGPDYENALKELGLRVQQVDDWSPNVARSYAWVLDQVKTHRAELAPRVGEDTLTKTIDALTFWVESARQGKIGWAFFVAHTPRR